MRNLVLFFGLLMVLAGCSSGRSSSNDEPSDAGAVQTSITPPVNDQSEKPSDTILFNTPFAIESKVVGEFSGYAFDYVFELENGQHWQQTTNKYIGYTANEPNVVVFTYQLSCLKCTSLVPMTL